MMNNIDFLISGNPLEYQNVLDAVRSETNNKYPLLIQKREKQSIMAQILHVLTEHRFSVTGYSSAELAEKIYLDMSEYSFLTPYLNLEITGIEEININGWNDIKIIHNDGHETSCPFAFYSKEYAFDIIKKMLRDSNIILDSARPCVSGYLKNNVRITVNGPDVVPEQKHIEASIRFTNPENLGRNDFILRKTASEEMLDFLEATLRYGLSQAYSGGTSSGKSTASGWVLSTLPDDKRIYTIEEGTNDYKLERYDKNGNVLNNVISTHTRYSKDPEKNISQTMLLKQGLTFNPDYFGISEVKDEVAYDTQEAARTGQTVVTTCHTNSIYGTPSRFVSLAKLKCNFDDATLYNFFSEAFPIGVHLKKGEDKVRRIVSIGEFTGKTVRILYQFRTTKNYIKNGKTITEGSFTKVNTISENLQQRLRENGMPEELIQRFI